MFRKLAAACLATALTLAASPAQATYAALAFSDSTGEVIATHDATSVEQAHQDALDSCKSSDCKIVFTTQAEWMAIAVSTGNQYGVASSDTRNDAMIAAYNQCITVSRTCHWRLWTQNSGNADTDTTGEFAPGPQIHPPLAAVGGEYSGQIDNFRGFAQLDKNLCWAAAIKTLYFNISGLELSQWKLARLKLVDETFGVEAADQAALKINYVEGECNDANRTRCEGGSTVATAKYLNILHPLTSYPKTTDGPGIWRALRRSIGAGFPAIITIDWYTGQTHSLVVYGIAITARPEDPQLANITLNVYDPENDTVANMVSNAYHPEYEIVPGRFTGMVTLANYDDPMVKDVGRTNVCLFLNTADRDRTCPS